MLLIPKIQLAINKAAKLHLNMIRKGDDMPYIIHPFTVAFILSHYTDDENTICAGLLHDVLEDVKGYGADKMVQDFGKEITEIVKEVSEDKDPNVATDEKATWEDRKNKYLVNMQNDSQPALMISCADKIHNLSCMIAAYKEQGERLWDSFNSPKDKKLWFYEEVYKILEKKLDSEMVKELRSLIDEAGKLFK